MRRRWAKAKIVCPVLLAAFLGVALYLLPASLKKTQPTPEEPTPAPVETAPTTQKVEIPVLPEAAGKAESDAEESAPRETEAPAAPQEETPALQTAEPAAEPSDPPTTRTPDEEAEAFLALFADDPEKLAYWQVRKEGYFGEIEKRRLPKKEADEAKRKAVDTMRRGELGLRAEAFKKTLPKSMTRDERGRAFNEFVFEQIEILGITDF